jgi:hypothetical protein
MITEDIFFNIIEHANFETITKLCQTKKNFYNLCKTHAKIIERIKCKSLQKTITENDDNIRQFALKNRYIFDKQSERECLNNRNPGSEIIGEIYDKI